MFGCSANRLKQLVLRNNLKHYVFKNMYFLRILQKTLDRWTIFDAQTIIKQVTFRHMQFLRGNIDDSEVEKDHFQKSDIFALSERGVLREITSPPGTLQKTKQIQCVRKYFPFFTSHRGVIELIN